MPEAEKQNLVRALDDLFRLSAIQADWKDLDEDAVTESLASLLVKTLRADFAYVSIATLHVVVELAYGPSGRLPSAFVPTVRNSLLSAVTDGGKIVSPVSGNQVTVHATPIGNHGEATLIVASERPGFPTDVETLLQRMAASQAMLELRRRETTAPSAYLARLIEASSDFIGIMNLQGRPLFVNPAGLQHVGLADMREASELHIADFLTIDDRDQLRYGAWHRLLSEGRWTGTLRLLNTKSKEARPFLFDCYRLDLPTTGPVAVGIFGKEVSSTSKTLVELKEEASPAVSDERQEAAARLQTLSARERQVLVRLAEGQAHKEIAHGLGISVRTVEVHRSRMLRRLGVKTVAEAIKLAVLAGLKE
ncbi:MAG: LuxR C-terminal-related transcriptional regulator [Pigmentiphaga sp.]